MSESLLFDKSPLEGEGQAKKKGGRRKQRQDDVPRYEEPEGPPIEPPVGFLLSLKDVCCSQCGAPADLAEVLIVDGKKKWRVMCGWWCMIPWTIDPIPGLLAEDGPKPFVIREGRFAGKTFDEVEPWYVEELARLSKNAKVKAAASAWLAKKNLA